MKAISAKERLTRLKNRTLWYDGDSTVDEGYLTEVISKGEKTDGLFVERMTNDIQQYNSLVSADQRIQVKEVAIAASLEFNLPENISAIEIDEYVAEKLTLELKAGKFNPRERARRVSRTASELALYDKLGLFNVLRTLIYIINTLQDKQIVWGVGRGSSVASYVLYLIGVHDVDSVEYDLDVSDFLRSA